MSLPDGALYGIQTARAMENFKLGRPSNLKLIYAVAKVKQAVSRARVSLKMEDAVLYAAVDEACKEVLAGKADSMFAVDALQGGAGTSTHMNVNEVLANIALSIMGKKPGDYGSLHPLDVVNRGQSTNDVYPTALRIAAIELIRLLSGSCAKLQEAFQMKENEFASVSKLGRTELMDALPITLGEEFGAFAQAIARDRWRLYKVEERLRQVNLGGAAVGAARGEDAKFRAMALEELRRITGIGLAAAEYPMDLTQNNDVFVEVSGLLKAHAVNILKISGDLRLMASGPKGGFAEISLAPLQAGSTAMPGKVNPVIPEMAMQAAMKVIAGDCAITYAASRGEFELNAFLPLIADTLLENLQLLERADDALRVKCIELLTANPERCKGLLNASFAFAAAYAPIIGYDICAEIIGACNGDPEAARYRMEKEASRRRGD
jgi:aspartate ammonia-lyase